MLRPVSLAPAFYASGFGATLYIVAAFVLGIGQLACAALFLVNTSDRSARRLLRASLIYLPLLLALLVLIPLV